MVTLQSKSFDATVDRKATKPALKAPKSILQQRPKYKPALVSPEKGERQGKVPIPTTYIETITKGFGENVDIFEDVLQVSKDALPREVRVAYFRRGREVLAEGGCRTLDQAATVSDVSTPVRTRFQAVSMAYEIASCAPWKKYYLEHGLTELEHDDNVSVGSDDPVSGSAVSLPGSSRPSSIRWKGQVEELLFEKDPEEEQSVSKNSFRKKKKKKTRVVVEAGHLDEHLRKLDDEADKHLVTDFWDTLEESLDGLLRMAVPQEKKLPDSDSIEAKNSADCNDADDECSVRTDDTPFDEDPIAAIPHIQPNMVPPLPQTDARQASPFRPISPDTSINRTGSGDVFDLDSIDFSEGDKSSHKKSVSTAGERSSRQGKKLERDVRLDTSPASYNNEDDVFAGIDDNSLLSNVLEDGSSKHNPIFVGIEGNSSRGKPVDAPGGTPDSNSRSNAPKHIALLRVRSESPTNTHVSELTGSTCLQGNQPSVNTTRSDDVTDDDGTENGVDPVFVNNQVPDFQPPRDQCDGFEEICERNRETEKDIFATVGLFVDSVCMLSSGEDVDDSTSNNNVARSSDAVGKTEDGFVISFIAYISAIVHDFAGKMSEIQWDDTALGAFMVDDGGIQGMQSTLEKELDKTPAITAKEAITAPAIEAARSFS